MRPGVESAYSQPGRADRPPLACGEENSREKFEGPGAV